MPLSAAQACGATEKRLPWLKNVEATRQVRKRRPHARSFSLAAKRHVCNGSWNPSFASLKRTRGRLREFGVGVGWVHHRDTEKKGPCHHGEHGGHGGKPRITKEEQELNSVTSVSSVVKNLLCVSVPLWLALSRKTEIQGRLLRTS